MLAEMFKTLSDWYMAHINYGTITMLMAIESSFIPLPSEIVIPPAIWKAMDGNLNMYLVVVFGTLGALIGALFNYALSYYVGRVIIYKLADTRIAKMMFINPNKVEKAETYFLKNGNSSTFVGRLLPGIRHLISIPAGLSKMKLKNFILFTTVGAFLWNVILSAIAYFLYPVYQMYKNSDQNQISNILNTYMHEISFVLLGIGVLFVVYLVVKNRRKKKKEFSA